MRKLLLAGLFSLLAVSALAGRQRARISVIYIQADNDSSANSRTAVVGLPYSLEVLFLGEYPPTQLAVMIEVDDELVAVTHLEKGRQLTFRYTFSAEDYMTAIMKPGGAGAEFSEPPPMFNDPGRPKTRAEALNSEAAVAFTFKVVQIEFNPKTGEPKAGKIIVSTTYKINLSCPSCVA